MNTYTVDNYHNGLPALFEVFENCEISNEIRNNRIWEPHLHKIFEKYINNESIVLEGGCHIGTHSIKLAKICKRLYTFEPMPRSNDLLKKNIAQNNLLNVITSSNGLSNLISNTYFEWVPNGNIGGSGLANNPMGKPNFITAIEDKIVVDLITIDSLKLDKIDFIKLDVEGYEELVIEGAMHTINKCRPIIIMEVWKNHYGEFSLEYTKNKFIRLLELGYDVFHIDGPDFLFTPISI